MWAKVLVIHVEIPLEGGWGWPADDNAGIYVCPACVHGEKCNCGLGMACDPCWERLPSADRS